MYALEFILGLLIVIVTIISVLFILVLPRQPQGLEKLTLIVNKSVHYTFVAFSRCVAPWAGGDVASPQAWASPASRCLVSDTTVVESRRQLDADRVVQDDGGAGRNVRARTLNTGQPSLHCVSGVDQYSA